MGQAHSWVLVTVMPSSARATETASVQESDVLNPSLAGEIKVAASTSTMNDVLERAQTQLDSARATETA